MKVFIIDGYNVLHELRRHQGKEAHGARLDPGALADERARLVDRIASSWGARRIAPSWYSIATRRRCRKRSLQRPMSRCTSARFERSADAIIERTAYVLRAAENVVVVTSDYGLQKTVFTSSVMRQSSRQFVDELQSHTRKVANSTDCTTMVHRVEERIDATSLERLKSLRDCLAEGETDRG